MTTEPTTPTDPRSGKPSASGLYRLALCPASWLAEKRLPAPPTSADAAYGTTMHSHMEHGTTPENPEDADAIAWCRLMEEQMADLSGCTGQTLRETRLWELYHTYSGQADTIHVSPDGKTALCIDYKFGRIEVEAPGENWQLISLALLLLDNYPELETVHATILQPFVSRSMPQYLQVTRDMQNVIRDRIHAIIAAANTPGTGYNPGMHQCRYCRAIDACPAIRNRVNEISQTDLKDWLDWSPEKKAELYRMSRLAKRLADNVEKRVKEDLRAGNPIPGFTLGAGRTCFKITDAQAAYVQLAERVGITPQEFTAACTVSITKVDELVYNKLHAQDPKYTHKTTDALVREILTTCGETTTTDGTIKELR